METPAVVMGAAAAASGFYDDGFGRFLVSPGFGGVAVLIGGLLAYIAARRQSADTRAKIDADRRSTEAAATADAERARQERWWATLTWVYDRATTERSRARLSTDLALDLLDRLLHEGQTELETATALGLARERLRDDTGESEES